MNELSCTVSKTSKFVILIQSNIKKGVAYIKIPITSQYSSIYRYKYLKKEFPKIVITPVLR